MNLICLISRQAMPNVLPVLMMKPNKVYLLTTNEEKSCGIHLENLFKSKNIEVVIKGGIDAYSPQTVTNSLSEIIQSEDKSLFSINLTGGTKVMSFAAYDFAREHNIPAFYCNTEHQQIIKLLPNKQYEKLSAEISIADYLLSYGYKVTAVKTKNVKKEYFDFFNLLESKNCLLKFTDFLDRFRSETGSQNPVKTYNDKRDKIFTIQKTAASVLLFVYETKFKFDDEKFLKGDWLEYYMLYSLNKQGIDPEVGIKIISESNVENEIDLVFIKNFQLFLISCKSGGNNDANKDIYEIETLRAIAGGAFGKAFLFTVKPLTERITQRAKDLKIETLSLKNLTHKEFSL